MSHIAFEIASFGSCHSVLVRAKKRLWKMVTTVRWKLSYLGIAWAPVSRERSRARWLKIAMSVGVNATRLALQAAWRCSLSMSLPRPFCMREKKMLPTHFPLPKPDTFPAAQGFNPDTFPATKTAVFITSRQNCLSCETRKNIDVRTTPDREHRTTV